MALDAAGNAWVADKGHNRIEKFDPEGKYVTAFGEYGEGKGQLSRPASLAIGAEGNIWVADANNNRVEEFSESGKYLSAFGGYGEGKGEFNGPEGIAIDPTSGDIWVSDTYNGRVQRFDEDGKFIEVVGSYGEGEGEIGEATGVAAYTYSSGAVTERYLWVVDVKGLKEIVFMLLCVVDEVVCCNLMNIF